MFVCYIQIYYGYLPESSYNALIRLNAVHNESFRFTFRCCVPVALPQNLNFVSYTLPLFCSIVTITPLISIATAKKTV